MTRLLPVHCRGLGVISVVRVAPSAFISSKLSCAPLEASLIIIIYYLLLGLLAPVLALTSALPSCSPFGKPAMIQKIIPSPRVNESGPCLFSQFNGLAVAAIYGCSGQGPALGSREGVRIMHGWRLSLFNHSVCISVTMS